MVLYKILKMDLTKDWWSKVRSRRRSFKGRALCRRRVNRSCWPEAIPSTNLNYSLKLPASPRVYSIQWLQAPHHNWKLKSPVEPKQSPREWAGKQPCKKRRMIKWFYSHKIMQLAPKLESQISPMLAKCHTLVSSSRIGTTKYCKLMAILMLITTLFPRPMSPSRTTSSHPTISNTASHASKPLSSSWKTRSFRQCPIWTCRPH